MKCPKPKSVTVPTMDAIEHLEDRIEKLEWQLEKLVRYRGEVLRRSLEVLEEAEAERMDYDGLPSEFDRCESKRWPDPVNPAERHYGDCRYWDQGPCSCEAKAEALDAIRRWCSGVVDAERKRR